MSKKIRYTNERLTMGERVTDFLPPPSALVKREPTTKVTLELTQSSLAFFKKQAKRAHVPYQRMLRGLIDAYENNMTSRCNRLAFGRFGIRVRILMENPAVAWTILASNSCPFGNKDSLVSGNVGALVYPRSYMIERAREFNAERTSHGIYCTNQISSYKM